MSPRCAYWEPIKGIDTPCADISFTYDAPSKLRVLMRFSNVIDGPANDLELTFAGPILLRWEDETISRNDLGLESLPKCRDVRWASWTFPLLKVVGSPWLESLAGYPSAEGREHLMLVSMNDVLDVLARPDVGVRWVEPA